MSALPPGACDSHVHVFQPDCFPYAEGRNYTPGPADCAVLTAHLASLGLSRCVVVQPSVYGTDNSCLLAALEALGPAASTKLKYVTVTMSFCGGQGRTGSAELRVGQLHPPAVIAPQLQPQVQVQVQEYMRSSTE